MLMRRGMRRTKDRGLTMKILLATIATLLLASTNSALASKTRIQFHPSQGCAAIVDFTVSKTGIVASEESNDGCLPDYYYGLGSKAKVKGQGSVVLLSAVDQNIPGAVFEVSVQYP